jgi:hypothetical protein
MKRLILVGILLAFAGAACATGTTVAGSKSTPTTAAPSVTTPAPVVSETASEPTYDTPHLTDFDVALKTVSKQCFGSAGCNYEVKVRLTSLKALMNYDPSKTYELTYAITGGEDGQIIGTLELTGDQYTQQEEFVSTSSDIKPKIRLTALEGY